MYYQISRRNYFFDLDKQTRILFSKTFFIFVVSLASIADLNLKVVDLGMTWKKLSWLWDKKMALLDVLLFLFVIEIISILCARFI